MPRPTSYAVFCLKKKTSGLRWRLSRALVQPGLQALRLPQGVGQIQGQADYQRPDRLVFYNDTATTEIYTLSLHDALPILNLFSRSRRKTNKRKSKHSAMLRNKETRHRMFIGLLNTTRKLA